MATTPPTTSPVREGPDPTSVSDWLEFVATLTGSLSWPIVVFTIIIIFRKELVKLIGAVRDRIPLMTSVKGFGVEAIWSARELRKVSDEVRRLPHTAPVDDQRPTSDKSVELSKIEPGAGVINAFLEVEREVGKYLTRAHISWRGSSISALQQSNLPVNLIGAVRELASLRNAAAHGAGDITADSALDYITTARLVARAIALSEYDRA